LREKDEAKAKEKKRGTKRHGKGKQLAKPQTGINHLRVRTRENKKNFLKKQKTTRGV